MKSKNISETKLKHLRDVLDSQFGLAITSSVIGYSLTYSKYNENIKVQKIADEFRIEGMTIASNAIINEMMEYLAPIIKKSMLEIPDVKYRIEEKNNQKEIFGFKEENINSSLQKELIKSI
jgi:hypothetical protein